jgi:hypothetical protein
MIHSREIQMNKTTMQRQTGLGLSAVALGLIATPLMAATP